MPLEPVSETTLEFLRTKTFTADDIKGRKICLYGNQGVGKTVLAARLGESNLFITDEEGMLSLKNHPELNEKSTGIIFTGRDKGGIGYERVGLILKACENGQYIGRNGLPIDNVIFDTVSGIVATEIRRIVADGDIPTENGKLSVHLADRPTYFLSEQNFAPLMQMMAAMHNCSVTLLSHLRTGTKDVPGASTHPDLHGAVYMLVAKYVSVLGYMTDGGSGRKIQVMPGNMAAAKTRLNFGKHTLDDEEFVEAIGKWKAGQ